MEYTIQNEHIAISVSDKGAELQSIVRLSDHRELLWQANPAYWDGRSPILFPVVGNAYRQTIRYQGNAYPMPKHGLVRQRTFTLIRQSENLLEFQTKADAETLAHYPFPFLLTVAYRINKGELNVGFEITNPQGTPLHYQLGGHPAFNLPDFDGETEDTYGYLGFDIDDKLVSNGLKPGGYLSAEEHFDVRLGRDGLLPLRGHTFDCDTILDTRNLIRMCTLYNKSRVPIVSLQFDAPVLALWAPRGGRAPFVCIEPWWGCCDTYGYDGDISERFCNNAVAGHTSRLHQYTININLNP